MQLINGVGVKTAEELFSQFPLWDFFECNAGVNLMLLARVDTLSQFPLWDFFECNKKRVPREDYDYGHRSLNSLCGISLNATEADTPTEIQKGNTDSQFPLWDFFECNTSQLI
jgi:hypothetical protein